MRKALHFSGGTAFSRVPIKKGLYSSIGSIAARIPTKIPIYLSDFSKIRL